MNDFIRKYQDQLHGKLSGFDRLVFRGTLWRNALTGMSGYLWAHHLGAKDFGAHAAEVSQRVKEASLAAPLASGRPLHYLNSGKQDKQQMALQIAAQDHVRQGCICVLSAVELCRSYAVKRNAATQRPELTLAPRKCLFLYHYFMHPVLGFMSVRLQTWFPFPVHIYLNGREWLARQMDGAGIGYRRHDNCFTWVENMERAQMLLHEQLHTNWVQLLDPLVREVHPLLFSELCVNYPMKYFWTCQDSEWAMDLMFRNREQLRRLVPRLLHLGVVALSSPDILRFMGKKVTRQGNAAAGLKLPLSSDLKLRSNGARIKHRLGPNSIKLYDKAYDELGAVLRTELTISTARYFQVYRRTDHPQSALAWRPMRQSTADMHHRAVVSQQALDRYCCALAAVDDTSTLEELTAVVERRVRWKGQSVRALHPFHPEDYALLLAVYRGEFNLTGFRNKDLQAAFYSAAPKTKAEQRRRSAAITRKLRILRAHGLIRKRAHSHRYDLSSNGRIIIGAILSAHRMTVQQINAVAA
ncbi:MAG TPA: hypothetical protein VF742_11145 [Terracidiphilus sp.]